jgi:hypothetical protein
MTINWGAASGFLSRRAAGTEWVTHFRYQQVPPIGLQVVVTEVGTTSDLGEPRYSPEGRAA